MYLKKTPLGPGRVAQLTRASPYAKVVVWTQSGHIQETTNECINKWKCKLKTNPL